MVRAMAEGRQASKGDVVARAPRRVLDDAARRTATVTVILASGRELTGAVMAVGADAGEAVVALALEDRPRALAQIRLDAVVAVILDLEEPLARPAEPAE